MAANIMIPPWLEKPDYPGVYQRGVALGLQAADQAARERMHSASLAQEAATKREAMALQREAMAQAAQDQANEMRLREAASQRQQQQFELEAADAARRVQGQMKYNSLIQSGMDPMQAMMQTPEVWGNTLTGVASAMKESERQKRLENWKPSEMTTPGGARMVEVEPGRWTAIRAPAGMGDYRTEDIPGTDSKLVIHPNGTASVVRKSEAGQERATKSAQIRFYTSQLNNINAIIAKGDAENLPQLKLVRDRLIKKLEELEVSQPGLFDEGTSGPHTELGTAKDPLGLFSK